MKKLDYYWCSNEEWYHCDENGDMFINEDAPPEAQESYKHYLKQKEEAESL